MLALETTSDGRQFAAAATVTQEETKAGSLNSYTLALTPTRLDPATTAANGPFAAVWKPTANATLMPPHPEDECEYFNGRDNLGNPIDVAIVVDTDTFAGTSVAPYSDHDCDGYAHPDRTNHDYECNDNIYDDASAQATLQTAVCASLYVRTGTTAPYCFATAPACTDGQPPSPCPGAGQLATAATRRTTVYRVRSAATAR